MAYPPVDIVDEHDAVVGSAKLAEVWKHGYRHRIVFVVVEDLKGNVLLQKRSHHMTLFPDCWDISASGHVDSGDDYIDAAQKELAEEVGLHTVELEELAHFYGSAMYDTERIANRFMKIFRVRATDHPDVSNHYEVSEVQWFTVDEIKNLIAHHPHQVAIGLREVYDHLWK